MTLALDLRFYSLKKYGLSVLIKELTFHLAVFLKNDANFSKVYLILDKKLEKSAKNQEMQWLRTVLESDQKFQSVYTNSPYYSLLEQTRFLFLLNSLKPDLAYFFSFNFPVLYSGKFIYQVLDLTHFKLLNQDASLVFKLKALIAKFILKTGLKKASKVLTLGRQTAQDITEILNFDLTKKPHQIIACGVSKEYLFKPTSNLNRYINFQKESTLEFKFETKEEQIWREFKQQKNLIKPYFLFVSSLKKHKNIGLLVSVFEKLQDKKGGKFQLVIAGSKDPKNSLEIEKMTNSKEFKKGDVVHLENLSDAEIIRLQDNSLAYLMPTLSEGFGLTVAEAAHRFSPVICSDLLVFKEILGDQAFYFDPNSETEMLKAIELFLAMQEINPKELFKKVSQAKLNVDKFRWEVVAKEVYEGCLS